MQLGTYRRRALWRVWAMVWQLTVGYVVTFVIGILGVVFAVIDLLAELVLNRDGLRSSSTVGRWVHYSLEWSFEQTSYSLTGKGEFEWLPSMG
ncbi:hypothetical protein [Haloferax sulfurifontis]|uniref:DUF4389 domain-containing protein n=2 Tax=Haloferax sulfurifontis TaxID=255616 RepID=M0IL68_9EURY|nr:hypothetical protein [Haloferax sulfurifontis]ELZ96593.1 hypothetical protein C441_04474 [Haloferax sulfurifontis ATCC BAA-897]GGC72602.1 hypothetical protein GCM10007209_38210 [Haloferax sulfurifontis]